MTPKAIEHWKELIDEMTQEDMCTLHRAAPSGHPCFVRGTEVQKYFKEKFDRLGGFTPTISKRIG